MKNNNSVNENKSSDQGKHNLTLKNRQRLKITGVKEVISYNEKNILLETIQGTLDIKGKNLKLKQLNLGNNKIKIKGQIKSMSYTSQKPQKGFLEKLFK
ncbi:MAG: sporulation protein YabP [Bacillota bacterium]